MTRYSPNIIGEGCRLCIFGREGCGETQCPHNKIETAGATRGRYLAHTMPFPSLEQRAQIEYDRRNGEPPALLELHWDTVQRCPVLIEGGYVISMNTSEHITLRHVLSLNHIYVDQIDGVVFGQPFDGELLDSTIEHLPLCQLTIRAPVFYNEYVYEPSMEAVMEEILEEIDTARCTE